jgi:hypothetical protein
VVQKRFYEDFPLKPEEATKYKFEVGSSMKATQIHTPLGSTNAIPSHVCLPFLSLVHLPIYHLLITMLFAV